MILILTDADLGEHSGLPLDQISQASLSRIDEGFAHASNVTEDVYFWRNGEVKPLKRRNAPLVVPDWIKNLEGVDR